MSFDFKREVQRKLIHLSSLWMVFIIWYMPSQSTIVFFGLLYITMLISELLRIHNETFRNIYNKFFITIMRKHETNPNNTSFVGAYYVVLAVFIAVACFSKTVAITSISVMLISDSAAALIGQKFGKTKLLNKTLEGSMAFMVTGFLTVYTIYLFYFNVSSYLVSGLIAVILATLIELVSRKINMDDNLTIVLTMGLTIELLQLAVNL